MVSPLSYLKLSLVEYFLQEYESTQKYLVCNIIPGLLWNIIIDI